MIHNNFQTLPDKSLWDTEEYLVPIFGNDNFLWRMESLLESRDGASDTEERNRRESEKIYASFVAESRKNTVEGVSCFCSRRAVAMASERNESLWGAP